MVQSAASTERLPAAETTRKERLAAERELAPVRCRVLPLLTHWSWVMIISDSDGTMARISLELIESSSVAGDVLWVVSV